MLTTKNQSIIFIYVESFEFYRKRNVRHHPLPIPKFYFEYELLLTLIVGASGCTVSGGGFKMPALYTGKVKKFGSSRTLVLRRNSHQHQKKCRLNQPPPGLSTKIIYILFQDACSRLKTQQNQELFKSIIFLEDNMIPLFVFFVNFKKY